MVISWWLSVFSFPTDYETFGGHPSCLSQNLKQLNLIEFWAKELHMILCAPLAHVWKSNCCLILCVIIWFAFRHSFFLLPLFCRGETAYILVYMRKNSTSLWMEMKTYGNWENSQINRTPQVELMSISISDWACTGKTYISKGELGMYLALRALQKMNA